MAITDDDQLKQDINEHNSIELKIEETAKKTARLHPLILAIADLASPSRLTACLSVQSLLTNESRDISSFS